MPISRYSARRRRLSSSPPTDAAASSALQASSTATPPCRRSQPLWRAVARLSPSVPSSTAITPMAKDELSVALAELRAETESIRLAAARRIRKHAGELTAESEAVVREAFAEESVPWVRGV